MQRVVIVVGRLITSMIGETMIKKEYYTVCAFCGFVGECNACCECQDPEIEDDTQSTVGLFL